VIRTLVMFSLVLAACGGEDEAAPAPAPPGQPGAPGGAAKKPANLKKGQIKPMVRIEERVTCPPPSDAKKCDLKAPKCGTGEYCIAAGNAAYCGQCPERDAIRHVFKPRDFQGVDLRDPFQSFVITQPGLGGQQGKTPTEVTPKCTRKDQFVASAYGYQSLRIVGIVSQGTQRKALMMGGNLGFIIKKGDCVGKEKAFVKDIGAGFITFSTDDSMEYSMQLYPTPVNMGTPDAIDPGASSAPLVEPPPSVPPPQDDRPSATTRTTVITQPQPPRAPAPQSQIPTQLKP
jgi:hypothetical protein